MSDLPTQLEDIAKHALARDLLLDDDCAALMKAAAELRRVRDSRRVYVTRVWDTDVGEERGEVTETVPLDLVGFVRLVPERGEVSDG